MEKTYLLVIYGIHFLLGGDDTAYGTRYIPVRARYTHTCARRILRRGSKYACSSSDCKYRGHGKLGTQPAHAHQNVIDITLEEL